MRYVELTKAKVSQDVLRKFDCGHPDFNDFLISDAPNYSVNGEGVTYILIDDAEENIEITTVFAFCTIKATALYYSKEKSDNMYSISCVEIKYFAIAKAFRKLQRANLV